MDVRVTNNGSTVSFRLETQDAKDWVNEYVQTEWYQWLGKSTLVVDTRYADSLINGMELDGLTVE